MWTKGAELHKPPHRPPIIQSSMMHYITFIHLADVFIQSDLQCIQVIHLLSVYVFPGNRTHNLYAANAMLYHWTTGTLSWTVLTSKIVLKSLNSLLMCWYLVFPAPQRCGDLCPIKSPEKHKKKRQLRVMFSYFIIIIIILFPLSLLLQSSKKNDLKIINNTN